MICVFSGYNQRAVIAFLRYMSRIHCEDYVIVAKSEEDPIFETAYAGKIRFVRKKKELDLSELLSIVDTLQCEAEEIYILPSTEALNRFVLLNREIFAQHNCFIPLVDRELYELISDKTSFWSLCRRKGFCVPDIIQIDQKFENKFVAKPKHYYTEDGKVYSPVIVQNEHQFHEFLEKYDTAEFDFNEFVEGESYYLLYYFGKNGKVLSFSQKNLLQQPDGKSILAAVPDRIHNLPIADQYIDFLQELKFFGLIMIELRKCQDQYYMIEANPRLWGPSQLFVDANVDFFGSFLRDLNIDIGENTAEINTDAKYYWSGGRSEREVWLEDRAGWISGLSKFINCDIYCRKDTMEIYNEEKKQRLQKLYSEEGKHTQYQQMPSCLQGIIDEKLIRKPTYERARWNYVLSKLEVENRTVLDIGGNSGFFTFEACLAGAKHVDYYEGDKHLAEFVQIASELTDYRERISVHNEYFQFDSCPQKYDIIICFNVIHHLGYDFKSGADKAECMKQMIESINRLADYGSYLVFQMGYNWGGDVRQGLFENGTKKEMFQFLREGTLGKWRIEHVGVAQMAEGTVCYYDADSSNMKRNDEIGEFLNRPIFILKSIRD